jgi:hypothetical protein
MGLATTIQEAAKNAVAKAAEMRDNAIRYSKVNTYIYIYMYINMYTYKYIYIYIYV